MWVLFGAVGVLLLIACANVSGLMLTRVSLRNHDDAIRSAIGGSRMAIGRLWAAETVWLTVVGGALGLLTCQWLIGMIVALAPEGIPRLDEVTIDVPVALFSITVMTIATLLCGAAPIRHASIVNLVETLNDGSRTVAGGRSYRTRSTLLVMQIGLAVVLLVAAGLVVRSFGALQNLDLGFAREACCAMKVEPRDQSQPVNTWITEFLPQVAALPRSGIGRRRSTSRRWSSARSARARGRLPRASPNRRRRRAATRSSTTTRPAGLLQGDAHSAGARAAVHGRRSRRRRRAWR